MIRFTVVWSKNATNSLAFLWSSSLQRNEVSRMSDRIDEELRFDAHLKGKELHEGLRQFQYELMYAKYTVELLDRIVRVVGLDIDEDMV
jgi:hypothetical protein